MTAPRSTISGVLRLAVAERPVLLFDLDQVDEHVFAPQVEALVQTVRDHPVEGALLLEGTPLAERDPDQDAVLGSCNTEVVRIDRQFGGGMRGDHLKTIALRDV